MILPNTLKASQETARELALSKTTVHDHKKHAISKLKRVLSVSPNAVAAYEGVSDLEIESQSLAYLTNNPYL